MASHDAALVAERRPREVAPASPVMRRGADWLTPETLAGGLRAVDFAVIVVSGLLVQVAWPDAGGLQGLVFMGLLTVLLADAGGHALTAPTAGLGRLLGAWAGVMIMGALPELVLEGVVWPWRWLWVGVGGAGLVASRLGARALVRAAWRRGRLLRHVALVGSGPIGQRMIERLRRAAPGVRLVGVFDDRRGRSAAHACAPEIRGTVDDLVAFARRQRVDEVIVALPLAAEERVSDCIEKLRPLPVDVRLCTDLAGFGRVGRGVTCMAGVPLLAAVDRPLGGWGRIIKAVEDRVLGALALALTAPLLLAIAAAVRLSSPGPILFRQTRYGFNRAPIDVLKFRTMRLEACDHDTATGLAQACRRDPRVTRLGRFLRRTSLDELPQLLNVLRGEMSLVGPRPHAVAHDVHYGRLLRDYAARHRVKPGITGWAQINGLRGETETVEKMAARVAHDLWYIEHWSPALDLWILLRTLAVPFRDGNAY
jgi:Undecaprenyl-phosphate glucose phosphotransferase